MQRYKIRCNDCDPKITPHENGKWVRWGDVERLRAELAECRAKHMDDLLVLGETAKAERELRAELAELRRFRKAIMDYDSNLYDALANSDAARKGEEA